MKSKLKICGIMSGTSLDGVDFVYCEMDKRTKKMKLLGQASSRFPNKLRERLHLAANHKMEVDDLSELHYDLGRFYSSSLKKHKTNKKWKMDLVGLHGQTVHHHGRHATLQIGDPSFINLNLGLPVVSDFRAKDIAAGGEGAPMASVFHAEVLAKSFPKNQSLAVQNIGGIGNVTFIKGKKVLSFDTGPGNMLMDELVGRSNKGKFDKDGKMAAKGLPDRQLVDIWLSDPMFRKKPPKSFGREEFGVRYLENCLEDMKTFSLEDKMATLCEFTVLSIARSYESLLPEVPKNIIVAGGGAQNKHLMFRLRYHLSGSNVITSDELGWPTESVEGAAFALLAAYRVWEIPGNIPETTGAKKKTVLGKLTV